MLDAVEIDAKATRYPQIRRSIPGRCHGVEPASPRDPMPRRHPVDFAASPRAREVGRNALGRSELLPNQRGAKPLLP